MVVDLGNDAIARIVEGFAAGVGAVENQHRLNTEAKTDTQIRKY